MVCVKKITLALLFVISLVLYAGIEDSFIEKQQKPERFSLSQARRTGVESYEALAHELATEIELLGSTLHRIMDATRALAEGKSDSTVMQNLVKDKARYNQMLENARNQARRRCEELGKLCSWITRSDEHKPEVKNKT